MSSSDGFCSTLSFAPGELGQLYTGPPASSYHHVTPLVPPANITPIPTPTQPSPSRTVAGLSSPTVNQLSTINPAQPVSPAQSNPASSSSAAVINNPTPTLSSVPLVTAANSSQPPFHPLASPPQTPMSAVSQSKPSSVSGSTLGKREVHPASESEKESKDKGQDGTNESQQQPKKRRIAPTLITGNKDPTGTVQKADQSGPS